jgi:hypothetical protein
LPTRTDRELSYLALWLFSSNLPAQFPKLHEFHDALAVEKSIPLFGRSFLHL